MGKAEHDPGFTASAPAGPSGSQAGWVVAPEWGWVSRQQRANDAEVPAPAVGRGADREAGQDGSVTRRWAKWLVRRAIGLAARIVRPMTLGVRVMARDGEGRVFLVRHSYLPGWYLPGGGVDAGETLAQAALRELREEGGLIGDGVHLFGIYHNSRVSSRDHVALFCIDRLRVSEPAWRPTAEIREIGFFAVDGLPPDTSAATRERIAEVLGGHAPAERW